MKNALLKIGGGKAEGLPGVPLGSPLGGRKKMPTSAGGGGDRTGKGRGGGRGGMWGVARYLKKKIKKRSIVNRVKIIM